MRTLGCAVVLVVASVASAEEPRPLTAGDRIRVEVAQQVTGRPLSIVGTLTGIDSSRLTLLNQKGVASRLPTADILRLQRSVHPSRKNKGAWIGLGVGFAAGFVSDALLSNCNEGAPADSCVSGWSVLAGLVVAPVGAGLGAIMAPGERWETVPLRSAETSPAPRRVTLQIAPIVHRARGLSVSVAFR